MQSFFSKKRKGKKPTASQAAGKRLKKEIMLKIIIPTRLPKIFIE